MRSRTAIIAIILAVVALPTAGFAVWYAVTTSQTAAAGKSLGEAVTKVCAKGGAAAAELGPDGACKKAAEVQNQPAPAQAATVDPDVLRAAARAAVSEYCAARNGCRGSDGTSPNFDAIVTAVVARIPAPKDGQNGANGENGRPGQNATADQVAAAVATYCGQATEPCRGPAGKNGADGANGAPGPSCPPGYELHDAVISDSDGSTYEGKACVDPATRKAPNPLPIPGG